MVAWIFTFLTIAVGYEFMQATDPKLLLAGSLSLPISSTSYEADSQPQHVAVAGWTRILEPSILFTLRELHAPTSGSQTVLQLFKSQDHGFRLETDNGRTIIAGDENSRSEFQEWEFVLLAVAVQKGYVRLCRKSWGGTVNCRKADFPGVGSNGLTLEAEGVVGKVHIVGVVVVHGFISEREMEEISGEMCMDECEERCWGPGVMSCSEFVGLPPPTKSSSIDQQLTIFPLVALIPEPLTHPLNSEMSVSLWVRIAAENHLLLTSLFKLISSDVNSPQVLSGHVSPSGDLVVCLDTETQNAANCIPQWKLQPGEWSFILVAKDGYRVTLCQGDIRSPRLECDCVDFYSSLSENTNGELIISAVTIDWEWRTNGGGLTVTDIRYYNKAISTSEAERLFSRTQSMCKDADIQKCKLLSAVKSVSAEPRRLLASHIARFESYSWETAGYNVYYTITNNHLSTSYIDFRSDVSDGHVCIFICKAPNSSYYYWSSCSSSSYSSVYLNPTSNYIAGTASGLQGTYTVIVYPYQKSYTYYTYTWYYSYYSGYYKYYYYYTYWSTQYPWVHVLVTVSCSSTTSACFCPSGNYPAPTLSSCKPCPTGNTICTNSVAQYCLPVNRSSYPSSSFTCQMCSDSKMTYDYTYGCSCFPPCYACSGSGFNMCTSCYSDSTLSGTTCICNAGYYKQSATSYYCGVCSSECATCSGAGNMLCLSCKANAVLKSGSCVCVNGYGGIASNCQLCHSTCLTCQLTISSSCTACKSLASLQPATSPSYCVCNNGYYMSSISATCIACHLDCLTCNGGDTTNCKSCKSNAFLSGSTCRCVAGYYGSPSSCQPCDSSCAQCTASGNTKCSACKLNASLQAPSPNVCKCNNGFYIKTPDTCAACHVYCATCTGPTNLNCVSCKSNANMTSGQCACNSRYYPSPTVDKCTSCLSPCYECVGNLPSQCTSCFTNATLVNAVSPGICACANGYYPSPSAAACTLCSSLCKTCSSATTCTSCFFPAQLSSPTCVCSPGYYPAPTAKSCSLCHHTCATCSGPSSTSCLTCPAPITISSGTCACVVANCVPCDITCGDCLGGSPAYCKTCNAGAHLLQPVDVSLKTSYCVCDDGLYRDGAACKSCDTTCGKCVGPNSTDCVACNAGASLVGGVSPSTCQCNIGFFYDTGTNLCVGCDPTCQTCTGIAATECITCYPNASNDPTAADSSCTCITHFFPDTTAQNCKVCHSTCMECINTEAYCTDCFANAKLTAANECVCVDSYFPNPTYADCNMCDITCKSCIGPGSQDCTLCYDHAHLENGVIPAKCECDFAFFLKTTTGACEICNNDCFACNSSTATDCTACYPHASLAGGKPVSSCVCDPMYLPMPTVDSCILCDSTCKKCSQAGAVYCTECYTNAVLENDPNPSKCVCATGYYAPISAAECILCFDFCKKCSGTGEFECTECYDNAQLSNGLKPSSCECQPFTYPDLTPANCKRCDPTCKKCADITSSTCTLCYDNAIFEADLPPSPCICQVNAYTLSDASQCLPCDKTCSKCSGPMSTDCTDCFTNAQLSSSKSCVCEDGYFPNPSPTLCFACHETCLHCDTEEKDHCTDCYPNAVLQGSICICPDGYFPNPHAGHCKGCDESCFTCVGDSLDKCVSCFSNASLSSGSTVANCLCDYGYFPNSTPRHCSPCHPYCYECAGDKPSDCISCNSLAELSGGTPSDCICSEGAYLNPDVSKCSPCHLTCKNCISDNPLFCLSCKNSAELSGPSPNACKCRSDFYGFPDASNCIACSNKCESCLNLDECSSCKSGAVLIDTHCECGEQYYADPDASNCVHCGGGCAVCSKSACSKCVLGFYFLTDRCFNECPYGYHENAQFECQPVDMSPPDASLTVMSDNTLNLIFNKSMTFNNLTTADFGVDIKDETDRQYDVYWNDPETPDSYSLLLKPVFISQQYIPEGTAVELTLFSPSKILDINEASVSTTVFTGYLHEFGPKPQNITKSTLLSPSAQTAAATATASTSSSVTISLISGNPATLISMVNQMQLLSYIAMSKIDMSEELQGTLAAINMGSAFSVPMLTNPLEKESETEQAPDFVQIYGFPSILFLRNAGPALGISVATLLSYVPIYLLSKVSIPFIASYFGKMLPSLQWGVPLKLWFTSYLDIGIFSFLQVCWAENPFSTTYTTINFLIGFFFFIMTVATPAVLAWHINKHYYKYSQRSDLDFSKKWGSLMEEFKPSRNSSIVGFYVVFTLRRLITIISLTLLFNHPQLISCINLSLSLTHFIYLLICRPYLTSFDLLSNICNEAGITFVFLSVSCFTFEMGDAMRNAVSSVGVWGVRAALFSNLGFAVVGVGSKGVEVVRQYMRLVKTHQEEMMKRMRAA